MRGYNGTTWVDEPMTEAQRVILAELGFEPPSEWSPSPWATGSFAESGIDIRIRDLPFLPAVNSILRSVGFRWDNREREWVGPDRTPAQVEALQALHFCAGRYYRGPFPPFAVFVGGSVAIGRPTNGQPPATGGSPACPVRVGA